MRPTWWPYLRWKDDLIPPSSEGLEGIHFTPLTKTDLGDSMTRLLSTWVTLSVFKLMVEGRTQFALEDLCHIHREKGYWCRIGEQGMMAHEYIIREISEDHNFIPVYVFAFGL